MRIQHFEKTKTVLEYNVLCQDIGPWNGIVNPPFGCAWALVEPGKSTKLHRHNEQEAFFIIRGSALISVGNESIEVKGGTVIYLPSFQDHTLRNISETDDLLFVTVYWDDRAVWNGVPVESAAQHPPRALVTAAPPTPNGEIHLGHLSGPYLAADIHTRYLKLCGVEAHFMSGTDVNQSYVPVKAARMGLPATEAADLFSNAIEQIFRAAGFDMTLFIRPDRSPGYVSMVQSFVKKLHEDGKLIAKQTDSPYCEGCARYLFEAHIAGRCPHCEQPTGGNSCEDCGRPNDCRDLIDPVCTRCGITPIRRPVVRLHFPLKEYAGRLSRYYSSVAMTPNLRSLCEQVLASGLPDIAVTHPADWGIAVPIEGFADQRLYAWCEMAPRYLAYAEHLNTSLGVPASWQRNFKSDDARVIQCFGFDNGFFYGVFVPALLLAYDQDIHLPAAFIMNEFYHLDGRKFSTSRNHAIWGKDMFAQIPADHVRFYLAYTCPETESTNFSRAEFDATITRELRGNLQEWLADLGRRVVTEFDGLVPATGDWTDEHHRFCQQIRSFVQETAAAYEAATFSPQKATRTLCELVRVAKRFGKAERHWRRVSSRHEERRTGLALELFAAKNLAILAAPIMPGFAARLWRDLGYEQPQAAVWGDALSWVPSGQRLGDLTVPYFGIESKS